MRYEDMDFDVLGTRRQRPMYLSRFTRFRSKLSMKDYPKDPHAYTGVFLERIDDWIRSHQLIRYRGLDSFKRRDAIIGTTHQLDELHMLHGKNIATFDGEYKYHRRLTDFNVKSVSDRSQLVNGDVLVISYPSCITAGSIPGFDETLEHCLTNGIPVHIDGAWFGQCRNVDIDLSHPAIHSVSVSLSKALGMGSQRIGIRYTRDRVDGPISIMNDFAYANVSDMWIGVSMMDKFGVDFWWSNFSQLYSKVCRDFGLQEADSIHIGWHKVYDRRNQLGVRTPLRMLIDDFYDKRGTDEGLNEIEKAERK